MVLQAVSDPDYKFISIDVGEKGRQNDGGTFSGSALFECIQSNTFNMPLDCNPANSNVKVPNELVVD